jgi:hypothetical protein
VATSGLEVKTEGALEAVVPATAEGQNATKASPKYAAKCAAVKNLQRLFFEEVGRSGDVNAAAATALRRLAETSRPAAELSPRYLTHAGESIHTTKNVPAEDDLVVREAEEPFGM